MTTYTGQKITELAKQVGATGRYNERKVYIAAIYDILWITTEDLPTLEEFKTNCLEEMTKGTVVLARIDMPQCGNPELDTRSTIYHPVVKGAEFQAVVV